eukprot:scaffold11844_cov139-Isochrysis_galbana.AAC.1
MKGCSSTRNAVAARLRSALWCSAGRLGGHRPRFGSGHSTTNSRKSQLGRGVRLLGFWALGRHAVPSICTRKTIGRVFSKDHPIFRTSFTTLLPQSADDVRVVVLKRLAMSAALKKDKRFIRAPAGVEAVVVEMGRGVALFQVVRVTTLGGHRLMLSILGLLLRLEWALFSRERLVGGSCSGLDQAWGAGREGECSPVFQRPSRQSLGPQGLQASSAAKSGNGSEIASTICGRVQMVVDNLMEWSEGRSDSEN